MINNHLKTEKQSTPKIYCVSDTFTIGDVQPKSVYLLKPLWSDCITGEAIAAETTTTSAAPLSFVGKDRTLYCILIKAPITSLHSSKLFTYNNSNAI